MSYDLYPSGASRSLSLHYLYSNTLNRDCQEENELISKFFCVSFPLTQSTYTVYTPVKGMSSLFLHLINKKVLDSSDYMWYTGDSLYISQAMREFKPIGRGLRTI